MSSKEQLWSKNSDLDARLSKATERNEHLMDELRAKEAAAATANGETQHPFYAMPSQSALAVVV